MTTTNPNESKKKIIHPEFYAMARSLIFGALCRSEHDIAHAREMSIALAHDIDAGIGVNDKGEPVEPEAGVALRVQDVTLPLDDKGNTEAKPGAVVVVDKTTQRPVMVPAFVKGDVMPLVLNTGAARLAVALRAVADRVKDSARGDVIAERIFASGLCAAASMLSRAPMRIDDLRLVIARAFSEALLIVEEIPAPAADPIAEEPTPAPAAAPAPASQNAAPAEDPKAKRRAELLAELEKLNNG